MNEQIINQETTIAKKSRGGGVRSLAKGIVFTLILIGLLAGSSYVFRPYGVDGPINTVNVFHSLDKDSVQVIIYGSSRAWRGVDPLVLYEKYGITAYNYGCNWQKINTTNLYVADSLRTQSPKVALVEAKNVGNLVWNKDLNGEIYYSRAVPFSRDKLDYLRQCFRYNAERYLSYIFPVLACHENWLEVIKGTEHTGHTAEEFRDSMGYLATNHVQPNTIGDYLTFEQKELPARSLAILDDIVETCHSQGTEVIFYITPSRTEYAYRVAMQRYCEQHRCFFMDGYQRMAEIGIDPATDFNDKNHLNPSGAAKMATYLGNYIKERYDLEDMRTVPGNAWETALSKRLAGEQTQYAGEDGAEDAGEDAQDV